MGYRSDVVIAIEKEVYEQEKFIDLDLDHPFRDAARLVDNVYYWVFEGVKWNSNHPEISGIENIFSTLDYAGKSDQYAFVRAGEDVVDADQEGTPSNFGLSLRPIITYDRDILNTPMIGEQNAATAA